MRIAFRADGSGEIGTGHLRRCLSLAAALEELGAEIRFVIRRHDAVAEQVMEPARYGVLWLPPADGTTRETSNAAPHASWAGVLWQQDAAETIAVLEGWQPEWVVVDHYSFDAQWHERVREKLRCSVLAVDDLGDRRLAADILLDANVASSHVDKYVGKLPPSTRTLVGPRFALLSSAYRSAPRYRFSSEVRSIGVFMGGTDAEGISAKVLELLRKDVGFEGAIEIVSTSANAHLETLARLCDADANVTLSLDLPDLSAFYARHDLQIGAGGTSSYERCCIGAPTVAIVVATNQLVVVPILRELRIACGATVPGVEATRLLADAQSLDAVVRALIGEPDQRRALSEKSQLYVDGRGAERVALAMFADCLTVRPATMADGAMLHAWRNDPVTRAVSINTNEIAYDDHLAWLGGVLAAPSRRLFVGMIGGKPVGSIRFDRFDDSAWEVSLYMDPQLHGLRLGKPLLDAGEKAISHGAGPPIKIRAQVVPGNVASMKMFESAGYEVGIGHLVKVRQREGVV